MTGTLETIVEDLGFIEGLRWHGGRLWYSDFGVRRVRSVDRTGVIRDEAWVPGQPSGLGFAPDGALMVISTHEGHLLRYKDGHHLIVADIGAIYRGGLNDMLTMPDGRCYISAFPEPPIGEVTPPVPADGGRVPLFLVEPDGKARIVAENLKIPNGMVYDAETRTLLVAESLGNRIVAFDMKDDGSLGPERTYVDLGERWPDGISLDSRGRLWVSSLFTSEFIRIGRDGAIDEVVQVPGGGWAVTCAVGDSDDELWCAVVETTVEDFQQGRAKGSIRLWRRS